MYENTELVYIVVMLSGVQLHLVADLEEGKKRERLTQAQTHNHKETENMLRQTDKRREREREGWRKADTATEQLVVEVKLDGSVAVVILTPCTF